jgi:hypothetical protein
LRRDLFNALAEWWHEATDALSPPSRKVNHRAYQKIIALGTPALPLILEELRDRGGYWFFALEQIAGSRPDEEMGSFEAARVALAHMGHQRGLI